MSAPRIPKKFQVGAWYWVQWTVDGAINVAQYLPIDPSFPWLLGGDVDGERAATKAFIRIQRLKERCPF